MIVTANPCHPQQPQKGVSGDDESESTNGNNFWERATNVIEWPENSWKLEMWRR